MNADQAFLPALLGALLAQDCQLCAAPSASSLLCQGCRDALPRVLACCPRCAMPAPAGELCGQCIRRAPHFDATRAALRYAFPANRLIQALKYGARLPVATLLADLMLERIPQQTNNANEQALPDALIPMPLHPARIAQRGFNQAMEIARRLSKILSCRIITRGIARVSDTRPQAELPLERRRANVRGAFRCGADLTGLSVAIVDDVMTTGATLDELARALKRAGAARVENWVAARTWNEQHAQARMESAK